MVATHTEMNTTTLYSDGRLGPKRHSLATGHRKGEVRGPLYDPSWRRGRGADHPLPTRPPHNRIYFEKGFGTPENPDFLHSAGLRPPTPPPPH